MKKTITLALSTSFLLGFAASVMAAHETMATDKSGVVAKDGVRITMDGNIRFRGKVTKDTVKDSQSAANIDGRVQTGMKIETSPSVTGYIQLETGDDSSDVYTWGGGSTGGLNNGGTKQADGANDLAIYQAWINYKFGGMFGTKIGHVPLALGNKTFFDHSPSGDDAIIVYADPTADTHIGLLTIKFIEGPTTATGYNSNWDDINGYVALLTQKLGGDMKLGVNITNLRQTQSEMDFYNLGVDLSGKGGPVSFGVDLQLQGGDLAKDNAAKGYCIRAEVGMAAGPANVGLVLGYGSGEDMTEDNDDTEAFVNFLADVKYETLIVGYALAVPGEGTKNTRLSNMLLAQVNAAAKITDDVSVSGSLTYMKLNEVAEGEDDGLGVEIDAFLTWKLGNGLSYGIEAGYLLAGDAWKTSSDDPDNAYYLRHTMNLSF